MPLTFQSNTTLTTNFAAGPAQLIPTGGGTSAASNTAWLTTTSQDAPVGSTIVVAVAIIQAEKFNSVSDGTANVYTILQPGTVIGFNCCLAYCINTGHDVPAASSFTVVTASGDNYFLKGVYKFNGGTTADSANSVTGTATSVAGLSTGTLPVTMGTAFGVFETNGGTVYVESAGFTNLSGTAATSPDSCDIGYASYGGSTASIAWTPSWTGSVPYTANLLAFH